MPHRHTLSWARHHQTKPASHSVVCAFTYSTQPYCSQTRMFFRQILDYHEFCSNFKPRFARSVDGLRSVEGVILHAHVIYFIICTHCLFFHIIFQDRRPDLSGQGGLGQLVSSIGGSGSFSSTAPRLSHTPTTDFQPPYFPPPYNLPPQQPVDFHHHANVDPYAHAHLNSFHQTPQHPYNQIHSERNVLRHRDDGLHTMHPGLPTYDTRRADYGSVRRPDVLMHGHHGLTLDQDPGMLNIHTGLPALEDSTPVRISYFVLF